MEMIYLIAYDIADDRRRESVAAALAAYGARVQFSVFECELADAATVERLKTRLLELIDLHEDQVRLYQLSNRTGQVAEIIGLRRLEERADFWII